MLLNHNPHGRYWLHNRENRLSNGSERLGPSIFVSQTSHYSEYLNIVGYTLLWSLFGRNKIKRFFMRNFRTALVLQLVVGACLGWSSDYADLDTPQLKMRLRGNVTSAQIESSFGFIVLYR